MSGPLGTFTTTGLRFGKQEVTDQFGRKFIVNPDKGTFKSRSEFESEAREKLKKARVTPTPASGNPSSIWSGPVSMRSSGWTAVGDKFYKNGEHEAESIEEPCTNFPQDCLDAMDQAISASGDIKAVLEVIRNMPYTVFNSVQTTVPPTVVLKVLRALKFKKVTKNGYTRVQSVNEWINGLNKTSNDCPPKVKDDIDEILVKLCEDETVYSHYYTHDMPDKVLTKEENKKLTDLSGNNIDLSNYRNELLHKRTAPRNPPQTVRDRLEMLVEYVNQNPGILNPALGDGAKVRVPPEVERLGIKPNMSVPDSVADAYDMFSVNKFADLGRQLAGRGHSLSFEGGYGIAGLMMGGGNRELMGIPMPQNGGGRISKTARAHFNNVLNRMSTKGMELDKDDKNKLEQQIKALGDIEDKLNEIHKYLTVLVQLHEEEQNVPGEPIITLDKIKKIVDAYSLQLRSYESRADKLQGFISQLQGLLVSGTVQGASASGEKISDI